MMSESPDSLTSSESLDVPTLRQKLSSVGWVQCENTSCMKWRKVKKEVADKLTSNTWWECSMNDDPLYKTCYAPEEDLKSFDRLAKRAKLVVFKSGLTPGSLVWAKTPGFCPWPALITVDPLNDEYKEEDEDEPDKGYYHVEYLGKNRSHNWVLTQFVELLGEGNIFQSSQKGGIPEPTSKNQKKSARRKKRYKFTCVKQNTKKEKRKYCGQTVEEVIEEALRLLPLSHEQRLKSCHIVKVNDGSKGNIKASRMKQNKSNEVKKSGKRSIQNHLTLSQQKNKKFCVRNNNAEMRNTTQSLCQGPDEFSSSQRETEPWSFDFLTSLIDVTKEERLFLDIKVYKEKEFRFQEKLSNFFSQWGLKSIRTPVWQGIKINLFDFFLAVHDRGGFTEVNSSGQWSAVFFELTNNPGKDGGSKAKAFYKRFLYPYELYSKGEDCWVAMATLKSSIKSLNNTLSSPRKSSFSEEEDLEKALDQLDDLLESLKESDSVVPDLHGSADDIHYCDGETQASCDGFMDKAKSSFLNPTTGSQFGLANEPDEKAQVVPEMNFPSLSGSSPASEGDRQSEMENDGNVPSVHFEGGNGEEWVLQELQALEYHF